MADEYYRHDRSAMIIDCISDLHGVEPELQGGDVLIVAGDLTARDRPKQYERFIAWMSKQEYKRKIVIGGNHDVLLEHDEEIFNDNRIDEYEDFEYLLDSGTVIEGLKVWGSPWTRVFTGQNEKCMAFALRTEYQLEDKFREIPEDTDILITHSPPFGFMDECSNGRVGSTALRDRLRHLGRLKLHVFGHIHEGYGQMTVPWQDRPGEKGRIFVNAAQMNLFYDNVNKPIRIEL